MTSQTFLTRGRLLLLVIVLIGTFLRFYEVGRPSLWKDESMSVSLSHRSVPQIVENRANDNHVPLYFVLLHYWVALFGDSEVSVRFPSVVFGIIGIWLIYRMGLLLADRQTALAAALILSISLLNILHARETRMYSLVVVLVLLSMQAFIRMQARIEARTAGFYLLSSILMLYTHLFGIFFVLIQNAFFLYRVLFRKLRGAAVRRWLFLQGVLVFLFVPWLIVLVGQLRRRELERAANWISVPTLDTFVRTYGVFSSSYWPLFLLFLLLSLLAVWTLLKRKDTPSRDTGRALPGGEALVLLVLWIVLPVLTPIVLSQFISPMYSPRYALGATPALFLLVAFGIRSIRPGWARVGVVGLVIILSLIPVTAYLRTTLNTPYWREISEFINRDAREEELVLVNRTEYEMGMFDYYRLKTGLQIETYTDDWTAREAAALLRQPKWESIWFVVNELRGGEERERIMETFARDYDLSESRVYHRGVTILIYQKKEEGV